jgi:hypothetical protein
MSIFFFTSSGDTPTANEHSPSPSSPIWRWPSSLEVAPQIGGCGATAASVRGARRAPVPPSNSNSSFVQQPTTHSIASRHMSRVSCGSMSKPSSSARVDERPVPKSTRPSESRSSTATDSALRTGWLYGLGISRTP